MKTTRNASIVPVLVVLTVLVGLALAIGIVGRGGQEGTGANQDVNAGLSNEELIGKALANMKSLKSYWVEFEGLRPAGATNPVTRMTMSGYELPGKGLKLTVKGFSTGDTDSALKSWNMLDAIAGSAPPFKADAIRLADQLYLSFDGGKTWRQPSGQDMSGLVMVFNCTWDPAAWNGQLGSGGCGVLVEAFKLTLSDAQPRSDVIDGVPVRHLTVNMAGRGSRGDWGIELGNSLRDTKASTMDVWVSTGATPRIVQTRYDMTVPPNEFYYHNEPTPTTDVTYSLTWTWSRFNEAFDDIKAPLIVTPSVVPSPTVTVSGPAPTPAPLKEYHMDRYDSDIRVNTDGSLDIVETLSFVFTNGSFHRGLRTWDLSGIGDITIKEVAELSEDSGVAGGSGGAGKRYTKGDFDPDSSTTGVSGTYGTESTGSELRLRWIYDPTSNSTRTFRITYRVEGAIRAESDLYRLDWYAVPPRWGSTINRSHVSVTLPEGTDASKCDAASIPSEAEMSKQGKAITWNASNDLANGFEVRINIPKEVLNIETPPTKTVK